MTEATTTEAGVLPVTFHRHADRGVRAAVGRDVPWWVFRERIEGEVFFLLESAFHLRATPASEYDGMLIRVDGVLVGVVDSKGIDLVEDEHRGTLVSEWAWPSTFEDGGAVTVGQIVAAGKAGNLMYGPFELDEDGWEICPKYGARILPDDNGECSLCGAPDEHGLGVR